VVAETSAEGYRSAAGQLSDPPAGLGQVEILPAQGDHLGLGQLGAKGKEDHAAPVTADGQSGMLEESRSVGVESGVLGGPGREAASTDVGGQIGRILAADGLPDVGQCLEGDVPGIADAGGPFGGGRPELFGVARRRSDPAATRAVSTLLRCGRRAGPCGR
jgi:hypothetical protein